MGDLQTRAQIVEEWYGFTAAAPPPPPPAPAKAPAAAPVPEPFKPAPYHADPDETVECPQCQKMNAPDASWCDQCGFKLAGATDVVIAPPADPVQESARPRTLAPEPPPPPPPGKPAATDVPNDTVCADPNCAHLASAHGDTPTGDNAGTCGMKNCDCVGMRVPDQTNLDDAEPGGPATPPPAQAAVDPSSWEVSSVSARGTGPVPRDVGKLVDRAASGSSLTAAAPPPIPAPAPPAAAPSDQPPDVDPSAPLGAAFSIPVAVTEGVMTDDSRMIAPEALDWRSTPMPLSFQKKHPDLGGHAGAVLAGRIEEITRSGNVVAANGHFLTTEDGQEAEQALAQMGRLGISVDVGNVSSDISLPIDGDGSPEFDDSGDVPVETLTKGTIMAMCMLMQAAFPGSYIILGDGAGDTGEIPVQTPEQQATGAEAIHVLSIDECTACNDPATLVASLAVPHRPPSAWFLMDEPAEMTPLRVEDDGRVYGHVPGNVCHTGFEGRCELAPKAGPYTYKRFTSAYVLTAEGDEIPTGPITVGTDHGDLYAASDVAQKHYADTGRAVADVTARDGKHGVWLCGAMRPSSTEDDVRCLRGSVISPDWRWINTIGGSGHYEMVAALAVNYGGFPTPRIPRMRAVSASGHPVSLVASGVTEQLMLRSEETAGRYDPAMLALFSMLAPLRVEQLRSRMEAARA